MASNPQPTAATAFTIFPKLPKELRCFIWAAAAPLRRRVIQVIYEPTTSTWHACKDGCGGLPSIIKVSREARKEALKGYTRAFDTFVDLEEDTVFISDPVFTLRKPRRAFFLNTEHTNRLRKIAWSSEVYNGLEQAAIEFPTVCLGPTAVLRKLENLTHFILALGEDGEGDLYGDSTDSEAGRDADEEDDLSRDSGVEDIEGEESPSPVEVAPHESPAESEARQLSRQLSRMEKQALEAMSRGYVRQPGNVHFSTAFHNVDHWDDASDMKWIVTDHFAAEKRKHPDWVRPKLSIMVVKYGLNQPGDYYESIHHQGDHSDVYLEDAYENNPGFDPIADAWDEPTCAADGMSDEEEDGEYNLDNFQAGLSDEEEDGEDNLDDLQDD
ncbi:hypothetical protein L207DRAFT_514374 [Hyaloscypha variabilis F]|uniref:2EXR domain-containing protein n=1 Tax=Hyaloscypha variabilis (strain UAMH 11265 / GT02V1 / F) TaxID=1149755 RepID=A0A2J6RIY8_HYAVF|nr:hypothetical protein L207DRAFT_514374 [Hyaloscypha variabilis F]